MIPIDFLIFCREASYEIPFPFSGPKPISVGRGLQLIWILIREFPDSSREIDEVDAGLDLQYISSTNILFWGLIRRPACSDSMTIYHQKISRHSRGAFSSLSPSMRRYLLNN
jgi:hypothetical protein